MRYTCNTSQKIKRILHQANIRVWVFHAAAKKLETPLHTHMDMQDHRTKTDVYKTHKPPAGMDPSFRQAKIQYIIRISPVLMIHKSLHDNYLPLPDKKRILFGTSGVNTGSKNHTQVEEIYLHVM